MTAPTHEVQDQPVLRSLLSVVSDGILATDLVGKRIYSNPALDRFVGGDACAPRESTAPPRFLPDASRDRYLGYIDLAASGDPTPDIIALDFSVEDADGATIEVPVRMIPVTTTRGTRNGTLWVFYLNDSGDRRHARELERTLLHIADELRTVGIVEIEHDRVESLDGLTPREREVFELLLVGHRVSTIADQLCVSKHTVRNHLKSIFRKTGVHSQAELIQLVRGDGSARHDGAGNGSGT